MINLARFIDRSVSTYLKSQLESGDDVRRKGSLQEICRVYRSGYRFLPDQLIGIELDIIGLTFSSSDTKVRRWALNALAHLGRQETCKSAIRHALQTYHDDAEVLAAAIAALYRQSRTASNDLRKMGFDEQMLTLAALQHVPAHKLELSSLSLNVETANPELIKLGLIVVGLNKAPPNMFSPNYTNSAIVRAVGGHHDQFVSQYSVWAITENPNLGLRDLGIDFNGIEQLPTNVRSWVFQLLAIESASSEAHVEYIKLGIEDGSPKARVGLAIGLKGTFSAVLVPLVLDWFTRELDDEVRSQILDHLIMQSGNSEAYKEHALDAFKRALPGSAVRDRMLATAAGTALFSKFSEIKYNGDDDLFRGMRSMPKHNVFNIGNIQAGALSMDGNASQTGTTANTYNSQTLEVIHSRLREAELEIKGIAIETEAKKEALLVIEDAKATPTKDNLSKVVSAIEKVELLASKSVGAATALVNVGKLIAQAAGIN